MIDLGELVLKMAAAGAPAEAIAVAVKAVQDAATSKSDDGLTAKQRANARAYEKRRLKMTESSTENGLNSVTEKGLKTTENGLNSVALACVENNPLKVIILEDTQEDKSSFVDATTPTKPPPKSRGSRLPEDWRPSPDDYQFAINAGLSPEEVDHAAREFRNFWLSKSRDAAKLRWDLTWQNRVGELAGRKRQRQAPRPGQPGGHGSGVTDIAAIAAQRRRDREGGNPLPGDRRVLLGSGGV